MARKIRPWDGYCPVCQVAESHTDGQHVCIRGLKVFDEDGTAWSQCLVCSGFYDKELNVTTPSRHDEKKGWFATRGSGVSINVRPR